MHGTGHDAVKRRSLQNGRFWLGRSASASDSVCGNPVPLTCPSPLETGTHEFKMRIKVQSFLHLAASEYLDLHAQFNF